MMKMQFISYKTIIGAIFLFLAVIALNYLWREYEYRYVAATNQNITLFVGEDASLEQITDSLDIALVNANKFTSYARKYELETSIKPGKYTFTKGVSYAYLIRHIKVGMQTPVRLTFNNMRSLDKLAGHLSERLAADSLSFVDYFMGEGVAESYGFDAPNFIAMFIPNTYELYWDVSASEFCDRMKKEYDTFWNTQRQAKAKEQDLTPLEVSTLASIVFEETKMSDEMPRVAGVYLNRLKIGMPLQADPTLKFALGDFSLRRILYKHLKIDSPYNTYKHKGLPPSPICMPSIKAIDAVLTPEQHEYLFFCASSDFSGYHRFSKTLKEHNSNAKAYSGALNQAKIYN